MRTLAGTARRSSEPSRCTTTPARPALEWNTVCISRILPSRSVQAGAGDTLARAARTRLSGVTGLEIDRLICVRDRCGSLGRATAISPPLSSLQLPSRETSSSRSPKREKEGPCVEPTTCGPDANAGTPRSTRRILGRVWPGRGPTIPSRSAMRCRTEGGRARGREDCRERRVVRRLLLRLLLLRLPVLRLVVVLRRLLGPPLDFRFRRRPVDLVLRWRVAVFRRF